MTKETSAQDERILNEKRRYRDQPFDIHPVPHATLAQLSRRLFEETYLPAAFAPDILEANDRSFEQRLAATKMIVSADDPTPTLLGVLVLANRARDFVPGAYVQFLRIAGPALGDPSSTSHWSTVPSTMSYAASTRSSSPTIARRSTSRADPLSNAASSIRWSHSSSLSATRCYIGPTKPPMRRPNLTSSRPM